MTYNHEVKDSYSVTVKVVDGQGGSATVDVTITLTDVEEPPATTRCTDSGQQHRWFFDEPDCERGQPLRTPALRSATTMCSIAHWQQRFIH